MECIHKRILFFVPLAALVVMLFDSCANILNEKIPDVSSDLASTCGITYTADSNVATSLPVHSAYSLNFADYVVVDLADGKDVSHTFRVEEGWHYYFDFSDEDYSSWLSSNGLSAVVDAVFTVDDSNGDNYGKGDESSLYNFTPSVYGTYTITFSTKYPGDSGSMAVYMWRRPIGDPSHEATIYNYDASYARGFESVYLEPESVTEYSFYALAGTQYHIHWVDFDSSDKDTVLSGRDATYGAYVIYDDLGRIYVTADSTYMFTPNESGTYILSLQTWGQRYTSGTPYKSGFVAFRIYK